MDYNSTITGQVIGKLRTQRRLSQEKLASGAGMARSHLAMIENGNKNATVDTLWRIAASLNIRLSDLFRMVEEEHNHCSFLKKSSE